jgi:hypothetical protein
MTVVLIALVTAKGDPLVSVVPDVNVESVPQTKDTRVLLAPAFITVLSCAVVVVIALTLLEVISGIRTNTLLMAGDLVTPDALLASKA